MPTYVMRLVTAEIEERQSLKLRILCLHGYLQNGEVRTFCSSLIEGIMLQQKLAIMLEMLLTS